MQTYWLTGANELAVQRREVDLGHDPPLFCRPRKSPKLNNESRHPSIIGGFGGMNSRRHSSVPRGKITFINTYGIAGSRGGNKF